MGFKDEIFNSLSGYSALYKNELLTNVLPFWMKYSPDTELGGYFNCLNRDGSVYDTDKFMWLQAREVWTFATMYQQVEPKEEWLEMARQGMDFILRHGRDEQGNWFFSLTRDGKPLTQPHSIFSDCFAAMALSILDKSMPGNGYAEVALQTFENILKRKNNPKGIYSKEYPGTRPVKGFALPMILSNLALEMEHILGKHRVDAFIPEVIHEVMEVFYKPELGLIQENVAQDGSLVDSFEGRLQNPGHAIEAMWFVMDLGVRLQDEALIKKAVDIALREIEYGWDQQYGGIFYFMDRKGFPPQQLEWDQKLWWVHLESLVAMAKGFELTHDIRCYNWFVKLHEYTWNRFRDTEYGEWYAYLNRQGDVLLPLKGGKWKCCFHVPRALLNIWKSMETVSTKKETTKTNTY
ncbi:AGE family epimerase/isomerase [Flavihumibacter sp. CACIAM 22H1]|uniref:AGE family epimerase/isomerase n=1 Tax=Flavihumibacter sp. CACIAM 22H1 TaxID=1812911 RepID=UPI000AADE3E0|nr:AGE family epimerase/isomerase [Flavihumibacter sp. CACIAM 22H1]